MFYHSLMDAPFLKKRRLNLPHSKKYSIQQVPAALLGRIGIDDKYRGQYLAREYLIMYALGVCNKVKNYIGCRLFIVEVEREDSIRDYLIKNGFQEEKSNKKFKRYKFGVITVDDKCVGCGLCAVTCSNDAIIMKRFEREEIPGAKIIY